MICSRCCARASDEAQSNPPVKPLKKTGFRFQAVARPAIGIITRFIVVPVLTVNAEKWAPSHRCSHEIAMNMHDTDVTHLYHQDAVINVGNCVGLFRNESLCDS